MCIPNKLPGNADTVPLQTTSWILRDWQILNSPLRLTNLPYEMFSPRLLLKPGGREKQPSLATCLDDWLLNLSISSETSPMGQRDSTWSSDLGISDPTAHLSLSAPLSHFITFCHLSQWSEKLILLIVFSLVREESLSCLVQYFISITIQSRAYCSYWIKLYGVVNLSQTDSKFPDDGAISFLFIIVSPTPNTGRRTW